ncbi:SRPBCC family protein [Cohnella yongneupensis]|uniref:SRPBCC family protein n=1 Tax=Cohnella yongneupensis TaxID=425006 RepID=A0ABW0QXR1_9BACL
MQALASLEKAGGEYIARFERHLKHEVEQAWSWLTHNDKLSQWFSELSVEDLREGGIIKFDMRNGTFIDMRIIEVVSNSVLSYTWGEDSVRFELSSEPGGCRMLLIEKIGKITDHTPKDLAGWHVCLDVIEALLDGRTIESRMDLWAVEHEKYKALIAGVNN